MVVVDVDLLTTAGITNRETDPSVENPREMDIEGRIPLFDAFGIEDLDDLHVLVRHGGSLKREGRAVLGIGATGPATHRRYLPLPQRIIVFRIPRLVIGIRRIDRAPCGLTEPRIVRGVGKCPSVGITAIYGHGELLIGESSGDG